MHKTLILEIQKGGLGDHLFYSHIPRIAKQTNAFDTVLISNKSIFRNDDYKKLIWELNPYVDGFTNQEGIFHFSTYSSSQQNMLDSIMLLYGIDDNKRMHEPEIYYKPTLKEDLKGLKIYDPNFISYTGDIKSSEIIKNWFNTNLVKIDYQMKTLGKRNLSLIDIELLSSKSIFDFCDILYSIKEVYCLTTGTATLANALNLKANVFYGKGHEEGYRHSINNNYIYLGTDYNVFDKLKKIGFKFLQKLKLIN
jgi:hypothetical protein